MVALKHLRDFLLDLLIKHGQEVIPNEPQVDAVWYMVMWNFSEREGYIRKGKLTAKAIAYIKENDHG